MLNLIKHIYVIGYMIINNIGNMIIVQMFFYTYSKMLY